jgi:hypothetical protein
MTTTYKAAAAFLALVAFTGAASAASSHSVTGKIEHINRAKHEIVLRNHTYYANPKLLGGDLRKGERVVVQYSDWHGRRNASSITPVKS